MDQNLLDWNGPGAKNFEKFMTGPGKFQNFGPDQDQEKFGNLGSGPARIKKN